MASSLDLPAERVSVGRVVGASPEEMLGALQASRRPLAITEAGHFPSAGSDAKLLFDIYGSKYHGVSTRDDLKDIGTPVPPSSSFLLAVKDEPLGTPPALLTPVDMLYVTGSFWEGTRTMLVYDPPMEPAEEASQDNAAVPVSLQRPDRPFTSDDLDLSMNIKPYAIFGADVPVYISPTFLGDREFVDALTCALVAADHQSDASLSLGRVFSTARNLYHWEADRFRAPAYGTYTLYGSPFQRVSIEPSVGKNGQELAISDHCKQFITEPSGIADFYPSGSYTAEYVLHVAGYAVSPAPDGEHDLVSAEGLDERREDGSLVLPAETSILAYPPRTVIEDVSILSVANPRSLTVDKLPSWLGGYVDRLCLGDEAEGIVEPALSFQPIVGDNGVSVVVRIVPVRVEDCTTGRLVLYQDVTYKVTYEPYSPVRLDLVSSPSRLLAGQQAQVDVTVQSVRTEPASGTVSLSVGGEVVATAPVSVAGGGGQSASLPFTAPELHGRKELAVSFSSEGTTYVTSAREVELALFSLAVAQPANPQVGSPYGLSATITNHGSQPLELALSASLTDAAGGEAASASQDVQVAAQGTQQTALSLGTAGMVGGWHMLRVEAARGGDAASFSANLTASYPAPTLVVSVSENGRPAPYAAVSIAGEGLEQDATCDDRGIAEVPLPAGTYDVSAEFMGVSETAPGVAVTGAPGGDRAVVAIEWSVLRFWLTDTSGTARVLLWDKAGSFVTSGEAALGEENAALDLSVEPGAYEARVELPSGTVYVAVEAALGETTQKVVGSSLIPVGTISAAPGPGEVLVSASCTDPEEMESTSVTEYAPSRVAHHLRYCLGEPSCAHEKALPEGDRVLAVRCTDRFGLTTVTFLGAPSGGLRIDVTEKSSRKALPAQALPRPGETVVVRVRDAEAGAIVPGALVRFSLGGRVTRVEADGSGEAEFPVPHGTSGFLLVEASHEGLASGEVRIPLRTALAVSVTGNPAPDGGGALCAGLPVAVSVTDGVGAPVSGAQVKFSTGASLTTTEDGAAEHLVPAGASSPLSVTVSREGYDDVGAVVALRQPELLSVRVHPSKSDDPSDPWRNGRLCRGGELLVKINAACFAPTDLFDVYVDEILVGRCSADGDPRFAVWEDANQDGIQQWSELVSYCSLALPNSVGPGEHAVSVRLGEAEAFSGAVGTEAPSQGGYDWSCGQNPDTVTGSVSGSCRFSVDSTCVADKCFHSWGRNSGGEVASTVLTPLADELPDVPGVQVCPAKAVLTVQVSQMDLRCSNGVHLDERTVPAFARLMTCPGGECGVDPVRTHGQIVSMSQSNSPCTLYDKRSGPVQGIGMKAELFREGGTCWYGDAASAMTVLSPGGAGRYRLFFDAAARLCDNPRIDGRFWVCPDCGGEGQGERACDSDPACLAVGDWIRTHESEADGWQLAMGDSELQVLAPSLAITSVPSVPLCPGAAVEPFAYASYCADSAVRVELVERHPGGPETLHVLGTCSGVPGSAPGVERGIGCDSPLIIPPSIDFTGGRTFVLRISNAAGVAAARPIAIGGKSLNLVSLSSPVCPEAGDQVAVGFSAQCVPPPASFELDGAPVASECDPCGGAGASCTGSCRVAPPAEAAEGFHRVAMSNARNDREVEDVELWRSGSVEVVSVAVSGDGCAVEKGVTLAVRDPGTGAVLLRPLADQAARYIALEHTGECSVTASGSNPTRLGPGQQAELAFTVSCSTMTYLYKSAAASVSYADRCACSSLVEGGRALAAGEARYCRSTPPEAVALTFLAEGQDCALPEGGSGACASGDDPATPEVEHGYCAPPIGSQSTPCVGSECGGDIVIEDEGGSYDLMSSCEEGAACAYEFPVQRLSTAPGEVAWASVHVRNPLGEPLNATVYVEAEGGSRPAIRGDESEVAAEFAAGVTKAVRLPASGPTTFVLVVRTERCDGDGCTRVDNRLPFEFSLNATGFRPFEGTACARDRQCVRGAHCSVSRCCPVRRDGYWFFSAGDGRCIPDPGVVMVGSGSLALAVGEGGVLPVHLLNPYKRPVRVQLRLAGSAGPMASVGSEAALQEGVLLMPGQELLVPVEVRGGRVGSFSLVVGGECQDGACSRKESDVPVRVYTASAPLMVEVQTASELDPRSLALLAALACSFLALRAQRRAGEG